MKKPKAPEPPADVIPLSALLRIGSSKRKYRYAVLDVAVPEGWIGATDYDTRTGDYTLRAWLVENKEGGWSIQVKMRQPLEKK